MKTFFTSLTVLFLSTVAFSQCVPNSSFSNQGVYPSTLDEGFTNSGYNDTLTIVYPVDTVISSPFGPLVLPFDSFKVDMVDNLPLGLNYMCNDNNCIAIPASQGIPARECVLIFGTPVNIPANDSIEINITAYGTLFGSPQSFSGVIVKAKLPMSVSSPTAISDISASNISAYPNPTTGQVSIQLPQTMEKVNVEVKNLMGQLLSSSAFYNSNMLQLELPKQAGIYLIEIRSENGLNVNLKVIKE